MRVGVDATCWANGRGYGRFARQLLRALTERTPDVRFVCFGDRRAFEAYPDPAPNVELVEVEVKESPTLAAASDSHRAPSDLLRLTRAVWRQKPDVFLSPSVYSYFPLPPALPAVVTIMDTIVERFPHLTLPGPRARLFWTLKVKLAIAQARLVLTLSEYSAKSITKLLGVSPQRIRLCVPAPSSSYQPAKPEAVAAAAQQLGLPPGSDWFIYVGGFNPHKRVDLVLRAHAAIAKNALTPPHLVLVGSRIGDVFHQEVEKLDVIVAEEGTASLVHWPGFVSDEDLCPLLTGATASLLPSEAEGFGLPSVEAAACGTPVIATIESPLPELLAGGGFFVAPGDVSALTERMQQLLGDPVRRRDMGRVARQRAAMLSWDTAADQAMTALREAVR